MIQFFRRIRQNLINQKHAKKYLLYAIGEILLVMIGILLALQVNNWNEKRILRIEEKLLLQNLKQDFTNVKEELLSLNDMRNNIIHGSRSIYELAPEDLNKVDITRVDSLLALTFRTPTFNNQTGTLDVLFNSGKINLIKNDSLKNILIEWPRWVEDYIETENYSVELHNSSYIDCLSKYISIQRIINQVNFSEIYHYSTEKENIDPDYSALLNDPYFKNLLSRRIWFETGAILESKTLLQSTVNILKLIDEILDN